MPPTTPDLHRHATDPLLPFTHEALTVPEWDNARVVLRELTAGDWIDYRSAVLRARREAGVSDDDEAAPVNFIPATALVLCRTLYRPDGTRVLTDADVPAVAASFSAVHGRLVETALRLSGIAAGTDPVRDAGNA